MSKHKGQFKQPSLRIFQKKDSGRHTPTRKEKLPKVERRYVGAVLKELREKEQLNNK